MIPARILYALRTAEVGTREFLAAVAWLVQREDWGTIDEWLAWREAELAEAGNVAPMFRKRKRGAWIGAVQPEEKAA